MRRRRLSFEEMKIKVSEHMRRFFGVEEFNITFAREDVDLWMVNIEYREKDGAIELPATALLSIDARTGEIREFRKGYSWGF